MAPPAPPTLDVFADVPADALDEALAGMERRSFPSGDLVVRRGEAASHFAVVLGGTVEVLGDDDARVALLGACSIIGELALLRGRPRNATVRAVDDVQVCVGGHADFARLCELPGVRRRLAEVVAARLADRVQPLPVQLRDGSAALLRPLLPTDAERYDAERAGYSDDTLYRRFASAPPSKERILRYLFRIDYLDHFAFVLVRPSPGEDGQAPGMGIGRYVRSADDPSSAEVALTVKDAVQGIGAGSMLLGALGAAAPRAGIDRLTADFLAQNEAVASMFRSAGGRVEMLGGGMAAASAPAEALAERLPAELREQVAAAVTEVLSSAGMRP